MAADPDAALHAAVPGRYMPRPAPALPPAPIFGGTLADVVEQGPELRTARPAGPDSFAPAPTWGELFRAARPDATRATPLYGETKLGESYAPILDALGLPASENPVYFGDLDAAGEARFGSVGSPSRLATDAQRGALVPFTRQRLADRAIQEGLIVEQIRAHRAKDKNFLPGVPDTVDGLHDYFEKQQAEKRAAGNAVLARGSTFGRVTTGLAAGALETARGDPTFVPSLAIGGGTASSIVQAAGRDALINGVLTAGQLPMVAHNMAENGEELTAGGALVQVVEGATIGAAFGGAVHLGSTHVPPLVFRAMPESVQRRWAAKMKVGDVPIADVLGDMDNRELAAFARSTIGGRMTADEKAAANALERGQELGEASPFMAGPAGDGAHQASLADALKGIIDGADRPPPGVGRPAALLSSSGLSSTSRTAARIDVGRASVPHDIVDFFRAKGLPEHQAYGIAAGISAEARGGDHNAYNPKSGAAGLGQWLGPRKAALIERYGPNPSRQQQLEFLWHELQGGDPGGKFVLAGKDAGEVLDAYIRKFMRPAAGAETLGDLERGMAALGRKGELPEGAAIADDDLAGAAARDADQAEAEAIAAGQGRSAEDLDHAPAAELASADVPILKRSLFASDADWFDAQLDFYRSQGLFGDSAEGATARGPVPEPQAGKAAEMAPGEASGAFGREFPAAAGDWPATLAALRGEQGGVVPGALDHPEIGKIDLPWGEAGKRASDGYGLAKLEAHHPDVIANLPEIIQGMAVKSRTANRIRLESRDHEAAVSLDWLGEPRAAWLLTAYGKPREVEKAPVLPVDRRGGTPGAPDYERGAPGGRDGSPDRGAVHDIGETGPIDNAALRAFDDGGNGRAQLADSLEHDYRQLAAERAQLKATVRPDTVDPVVLKMVSNRGRPGLSIERPKNAPPESPSRAIVFRDREGAPRGVVLFRTMSEADGSVRPGELETRPDYGAGLTVFVDPGHRRQGIATQMYAFAKAEGFDLSAVSGKGDLTPDGAAFVNDRRVRASRVYEVDGRGITLEQLLEEFDRDRAAAAALRSCAGGGA